MTIKLRGLLLCLGVAAALLPGAGCGHSGSSIPVPALAEIQISPANSLIQLGASSPLKATAVFSDGSKQNVTSVVTWSASSSPSATNFVAVDSTGLATAMAPGTSTISARLDTVIGVTQLTVNTNGLSSSTIGVLTVPFQGTRVDAAYFPQSKTPNAQGIYTVQAINLEADQFSDLLPVPSALLASIAMPAGYIPNATAAAASNPNNPRVVVISYSSPNVQIIDANSDNVNDLTSNTVVSTFTAPVTSSVSFNGVSCIICGIVINPAGDQAILSTAQGYFTMDVNAGTFTALPVVPPAFPGANFTVNPLNQAAELIFSSTYGQDPNSSGEVQILDLAGNSAVTNTGLGVATPSAVGLDLFTNLAVVNDQNSANQVLLNLNERQNLTSTTWSASQTVVPLTAGCGTPPVPMSMVAIADGVASQNKSHIVFSSQLSGNCVGFEALPFLAVAGPPDPATVTFGYGAMPSIPGGAGFSNGNDPNSIAAFVSIFNKKIYGLLVNSNQDWIARLDLGSLGNLSATNLPDGQDVSQLLLAGHGGNPIVYLPTAGPLEICTIPTAILTLPPGTCN